MAKAIDLTRMVEQQHKTRNMMKTLKQLWMVAAFSAIMTAQGAATVTVEMYQWYIDDQGIYASPAQHNQQTGWQTEVYHGETLTSASNWASWETRSLYSAIWKAQYGFDTFATGFEFAAGGAPEYHPADLSGAPGWDWWEHLAGTSVVDGELISNVPSSFDYSQVAPKEEMTNWPLTVYNAAGDRYKSSSMALYRLKLTGTTGSRWVRFRIRGETTLDRSPQWRAAPRLPIISTQFTINNKPQTGPGYTVDLLVTAGTPLSLIISCGATSQCIIIKETTATLVP